MAKQTPSPVTAAKWLRPHLIRVTAPEGLNSERPNSVGGILSGVDDSDSLGPFPRMPYPQTNTSPSSDGDELIDVLIRSSLETHLLGFYHNKSIAAFWFNQDFKATSDLILFYFTFTGRDTAAIFIQYW